MNVRRGLFRVWVVLSALYVLVLMSMAASDFPRAFEQASVVDDILAGGTTKSKGVPMKCEDMKAVPDAPWMKDPHIDDGLCWFSLTKYRELYPEHKVVEDLELVKRLYSDAGRYLWVPEPWWALAKFAFWAVAAPLALLAFGAAIYWALAGFSREPTA